MNKLNLIKRLCEARLETSQAITIHDYALQTKCVELLFTCD